MNIKIPQEAIEALENGERVEITHPSLGRAGANGSITLEPAGDSDGYVANWSKR
jgi:hypothetical protein